jgi:hypothetical protein
MIRDRDRIYGSLVTRRLRAMGIRDKPTAPASPWQNGVAERLIGSIRRECVDHIIVLGEMHLLRVLKSYADYYNSFRTHRSLKKDAPVSRRVQRIGVINLRSIPHASSRVLSFTLDRVEFAPRILRPIQRETIANEPLCKVSPATEHEATVRPYWSREIGSSSLAVSLRSRRDHWPPSRRTDTASYHLPGKADCFPEPRCPIAVCDP